MNNSSKAAVLLLLLILASLSGCSGTNSKDASASAPASPEPETLSLTEFTDRLENYFEYEPLHAGKPSPFRIHLSDLSDGSPVEQAEVTLAVRPTGSSQVATQTVSRIGKVTGIYIAELTIPKAGDYDIEFHIKNAKLDERLPLSGFKVQ